MNYRSYSQPDGTVVNLPYTRTTTGSCSGTSDPSEVLVVRKRRGAYSGQNTPNFKALRKAKALLPQNLYERHDYDMSRSVGVYTIVNKSPWCGTGSQTSNIHRLSVSPLLGTSGDTISGIPALPACDWNVLLVKALAQCQADFDALTFLSEFHKTLDMVLHIRKRAVKLITAALKGGKHTAKAASSAWLEWRYGWQTLGMDIEDAQKALLRPRPLIVRGKAGEAVSNTVVGQVTDDVWSYAWVGNSADKVTFRTIRSYSFQENRKAVVFVRVRHKTLNASFDIPTTLWELVPYSFVADWFVNVGECIKALSVLRSCDFLQASCSTRLTGEATSVLNLGSPEGPDIVSAQGGGGTCTEKYTGLSRHPGWRPSLVPSLTVEINSKRIADAASLLIQRIL